METRTDKKLLPFLAALCLFLAAVEYAIPKPLPFMRLGLANLPVILSLFLLPYRKILILVLLKTVGQGLITGTLFSYIFLFSAGGTLASAMAMMLAYRLFGKHVSAVGLSLAGAAANNIAQLLIAWFILFGDATRYIAPLLLVSGTVSAVFLGIFTENFMRKSLWFRRLHG